MLGDASDVVGISVAVAVGRSMVLRAVTVECEVDVANELRTDGWP